MRFRYKAKNNQGEVREGVLEAKSQLELARQLHDKGFFVLEAHVEGGSDRRSLRSFGNLNLHQLKEGLGGVSLSEKMLFSRNLSVMISSGVPLTRSLEVLTKQTQSQKFRRAIEDVNERITKGESFSKALSAHPHEFSRLYTSMIRVGEASGKVDESLDILAGQLEKEHELKSRVRGALIYPSIIIVAAILVGALMLIVVIPSLSTIFEDLNAKLPITTRAILKASDLLSRYWFVFLGVLAAILVIVKKYSGTESGRSQIGQILLYLPVLANLVREINNARFARTLSSLIEGGTPILEALEIVSDTLTNAHYRDSIKAAHEKVKKGENLYKVLEGSPHLYTPLVVEMVQVGEETGKLPELLNRIAEFYEGEVNDATKNLSSVIEPVLMVVIGAVVGFFAISIIQPIYGLIGNI